MHTAAAMASHQLQLPDLPEDIVLRIALHLPFTQRLRLSEVCHKLRQLCAGPSEMWRMVEAHPTWLVHTDPVLRWKSHLEAMACYRR